MKTNLISWKHVVALIWAFSGLAACDDDDNCRKIYYPAHSTGCISMGTVKDGEILTDKGNTLIIDETSVEHELEEGKRVFISGEILDRESETRYLVKVNKYHQLLEKSYITMPSDTDTLGHDAVNILRAWFGGECLNLQAEMYYNPSSGISHLLNLVYNDTLSTNDTLRFSLRHNAYGDTLKTRTGRATASFHIDTLTTKEKTHVIVEYPWYDRHGKERTYVTEGDYYIAEENQEEETENNTDTAEDGTISIH